MERWTHERFRRIILDLHLPDFSPELASKLDAERVADCMSRAGCEVLVLPAKNHFGLTTYPTSVGTRHPNISGDLFGETLELCHERDIKVVAYYSIGWDEAYRKRNAGCEQLSVVGTPVVTPPFLGYGAPWTLMCLNTPYRDHCLEQIRELTAYPLDGLWLDIAFYLPFTCYCKSCKSSFRRRTGRSIPRLDWDDPLWREFVQFKADTLADFFARATALARANDPDMPVTYNLPAPDAWATSGQQASVSRQVEQMTYLASEVHFDMYGTLSLPVEVEVDRALVECPPEIVLCRFADGWDWTIKPTEQMLAECAAAVSRGAAVLLIDHAYPDGALDDEVYSAIGSVFERVKQIEPWVAHTEPRKFAAVLLSERTLFAYGREDPTRHVFPFYGACRTLLEQHIPFRVVTDANIEAGIEQCEVLILPNAACLSDAACRTIRDFVEGGGTLIATYQTSFFDESGERRAEPGLADLFGVEVVGELGAVHYVRLSGGEPLFDDAPSRPIPLYGPTLLVEPRDGTAGGGRVVKPFPTGEGQFVTHGFAPPGETTSYPVWTVASVGAGKVVYFPGRICESLVSGDPNFRRLFAAAVAQARGGVPLRTDAPRCLDVSWRVRDNADILHLVNIQYPTGRTFPVFSPESYWKMLREASAAFPVKELPASLPHRALRLGLKAFAPLFKDKSTRRLLDFIDRLPKRGVEVADRVPPVSDVTLLVRKRSAELARVYSPFTGDLSYDERGDGFVAVKVPRVAVCEVVVLEYD